MVNVMSRSYKRFPYCGDAKGKAKKRLANRHIRQVLKRDYNANINHGAFKKYYESYNICDYGFICPWEKYWAGEIECFYRFKRRFGNAIPPNKQLAYKRWLKWYRNK